MPSTLPASRCCGLVEFRERDLSVVRSETCRSGLRDSTGLMSVPASEAGSGPECWMICSARQHAVFGCNTNDHNLDNVTISLNK